jgi:hypothetical protein
MKQALFLFFCLIASVFSFAQINSPGQDHIKIIVAKDSLHVSFKNKSFKLNNIQDLDGWLKQHIMETSFPEADLEFFIELTPENHRAIIVIMDKYRCPVVSERMVSDGKPKIAGAVRYKNL